MKEPRRYRRNKNWQPYGENWCRVNPVAAADEIAWLQTVIRCERESGTCVMVHDPEREPCTRRNCHYMGVRDQQKSGEQR